MLDPIILYSPDGQRTKSIAAIDAPGWINAGWTSEQLFHKAIESAADPIPEEIPPPDPQATKKVKNAGNSLPES